MAYAHPLYGNTGIVQIRKGKRTVDKGWCQPFLQDLIVHTIVLGIPARFEAPSTCRPKIHLQSCRLMKRHCQDSSKYTHQYPREISGFSVRDGRQRRVLALCKHLCSLILTKGWLSRCKNLRCRLGEVVSISDSPTKKSVFHGDYDLKGLWETAGIVNWEVNNK
jgi:hypothetical protein